MKKLLSVLSLAILLTMPCFASEATIEDYGYTRLNVRLYVDGEEKVLTQPVILNPSTQKSYMPVRALGDAIGKKVTWSLSEVLIQDDTTTVRTCYDNSIIEKDGKQTVSSTGDITVSCTTYLPLRFIPEQFGFVVTYFDNNGSPEIHLTSAGHTAPVSPVHKA